MTVVMVVVVYLLFVVVKGDYEDELVLLMASENEGEKMVDWGYMDTGCSNHLTRNNQWLVDFDSGRKTKIICANDEYLNSKGMGNVKVKLKNGKNLLINGCMVCSYYE